MVAAVLTGVGMFRPSSEPVTVSAASTPPPSNLRQHPNASRGQPRPSAPTVTYPAQGPNTFSIAAGSSGVLGSAGTRLRFRVAVENGITGLPPAAFATDVTTVLGSPGSWIGTRKWRFQRVGADSAYDFTIYLVTPATRDRLCQDGYDRYTSCRMGDKVVINVARWVHGVPNYGAPLQTYRFYAINHEVGHRLGHAHELCPGAGQPAPVMQQQSLGLHGCVANPWPVVDGRAYDGPLGAYQDPIPKSSA
jgi:hypothetical protein